MADTVVVGCKLPHGLETTIGGKTVLLNGANSATIIGGYGLTEGVDKAGFEEWLVTYADAPFVRNELIFSQANIKEAAKQAESNATEKTGLEGLDANKPAPGIEPDPDQKQKA
jgi:hypothetical protein